LIESSNGNGGRDNNTELNELARSGDEGSRDERDQSHLLSSFSRTGGGIQASELGGDLSTILSIAKDVSLVIFEGALILMYIISILNIQLCSSSYSDHSTS